MKASEGVPRVGAALDDLPELTEILAAQGPFVSVVLPTERTTDDARARFDRRWQAARASLVDRGAPADVLDRVERAILEERTEDDAVACLAAVDGPSVTTTGASPKGEVVAYDSLPRLTPLIDRWQEHPPGLLVVTDRTGADVFVSGRPPDVAEVVHGVDGPVIRRSTPGGWSQRRFQQRAENAWRDNAAEVASAIDRHVAAHEARIVVLAGEERAVSELLRALPDRLHGIVRQVRGGRGPGADGTLEDWTRRWYRTAVAEDSVALIERLKEEVGRRDLGVTGLEASLHALRSASVDTLLVHDDPAIAPRLFFRRSDPLALAAREADLEGTDLVDGHAPDVLVRAAWASGARVRVVPRFPELTEDVACLLRFPALGTP
jgi:hypothetical protein